MNGPATAVLGASLLAVYLLGHKVLKQQIEINDLSQKLSEMSGKYAAAAMHIYSANQSEFEKNFRF